MRLFGNGRLITYPLVVVATVVICVITVIWATGSAGVLPIIGKSLGSDHFADQFIPLLTLAITWWILIALIITALHLEFEALYISNLGISVQKEDWHVRKGALTSLSYDFYAKFYFASIIINSIVHTGRVANRLKLMLKGYNSVWVNPHDTLPSAAAIDSVAITNKYSTIHALIWTIPVLGFIGTALGLSGSVGGFQQVLTHKETLTDTSLLLSTVGKTVISELAGSFSNTVFALICAAVAFVCTTGIETYDNELLNELNFICENFLWYFPNQLINFQIEHTKRQIALISSLETRFGSFQSSVEHLTQACSVLNDGGYRLHMSINLLEEVVINFRKAAIEFEQAVNSSVFTKNTELLLQELHELTLAVRDINESTNIPIRMVFERDKGK